MAEQLKNTVLPVNTSMSRNLAPCVKNGRTAVHVQVCEREEGAEEGRRGGGEEERRGGGEEERREGGEEGRRGGGEEGRRG